MKKRISIAASSTASFALWAAVWSQTTVDKEKSRQGSTPSVIAPQTIIPELSTSL